MPALRKLIRRFNDLCAQAKACYKRKWNIPLPQPLPEEIAKLKKDPGLMEDVWISSAPSTTYQWLYDADIREAMRAVHRKERCLEEIRRLGTEMDNLCQWFGSEMKAVEIALALPGSTFLQSIFFDSPCSRPIRCPVSFGSQPLPLPDSELERAVVHSHNGPSI